MEYRIRQGTGSKWDSKVRPGTGMAYTDLRYKVAEAVVDGNRSLGKVSAQYKVSKSFVHKWSTILGEWRALGMSHGCGMTREEVMRSLSNRPHNIRYIVPKETRDRIVGIRKQYPFYGSAKIRAVLASEGFELPCCRTIDRIVREADLAKEKEVRVYGKSYGHFQRPASLDLLQIDYKDWCHDAKGNLICSIWVLDDRSRCILGVKVSDHHSADDVIDLLEEVVATFGKPRQILSDHGTEFYSVSGGKGKGRLDEWCRENGIDHIMGRVKHPQTQGKIERSHGSAVREIRQFGRMDTLEGARRTILRWIEFYNLERPHQSLGYRKPMDVFMDWLMFPLPCT